MFTGGAGKEEVGLAVGEVVVDEIEEVAISRPKCLTKGPKGRRKEERITRR
jgi:hypothetical protein